MRRLARVRTRYTSTGYVQLCQGIYLGSVLLGISWYVYRLIGEWMFRIWVGGI